MSAGGVLQAGCVAALRTIAGLAVFDAPPVRGAVPFAVVGEPMLVEWNGAALTGREGRVIVTLTDEGERPVRLRGLMAAAGEALPGAGPALGEGWRLVRLRLVRSRMAREGPRWVATAEFQVRMYREQA